MKLETENVQETEASAELVRELMADDAKRGNWLILMHDEDEEAFIQIAFDDHPDGVDLEYREGANGKLYHCTRPVTRLEAENAVLDYFDGLESWKSRFTWEEEEGYGEPSSRSGGLRLKWFLVALALGVLAWGGVCEEDAHRECHGRCGCSICPICVAQGALAAKLINTPTAKEGLVGTFQFKMAILGAVETLAVFALVGTIIVSARPSA